MNNPLSILFLVFDGLAPLHVVGPFDCGSPEKAGREVMSAARHLTG